jgi:hypothetical protein
VADRPDPLIVLLTPRTMAMCKNQRDVLILKPNNCCLIVSGDADRPDPLTVLLTPLTMAMCTSTKRDLSVLQKTKLSDHSGDADHSNPTDRVVDALDDGHVPALVLEELEDIGQLGIREHRLQPTPEETNEAQCVRSKVKGISAILGTKSFPLGNIPAKDLVFEKLIT